MIDKYDKYEVTEYDTWKSEMDELKSKIQDGTTSGMEQRIETLEKYVTELQNYIGDKTPDIDADDTHSDHTLECDFCHQCLPTVPSFNETFEDLMYALKAALRGLDPKATVNQQNVSFYIVRNVLNKIEEKK